MVLHLLAAVLLPAITQLTDGIKVTTVGTHRERRGHFRFPKRRLGRCRCRWRSRKNRCKFPAPLHCYVSPSTPAIVAAPRTICEDSVIPTSDDLTVTWLISSGLPYGHISGCTSSGRRERAREVKTKVLLSGPSESWTLGMCSRNCRGEFCHQSRRYLL